MADSSTQDVGIETLRRMKKLTRYGRWVFDRILPYVGERVLEAGSGLGNNSVFFLDRELLILTDVRQDFLDHLRQEYRDRGNVDVERFDLEGSGSHLRGRNIDTIVALNVLEHIRDDRNALAEMAAMLAPGGRVILQLPAHPLLYGSLDRNLDHYRRYTISGIREKFTAAGLTGERFDYMNLFGAAGWLVSSRILRRTILPEGQLGLFNTLTPLFIAVENVIPMPAGLSIIAVGRKDA